MPVTGDAAPQIECSDGGTLGTSRAAVLHVHIQWRCDGEHASLEVLDDGVGFPDGHEGRIDSYGILGMRERAASIGASLEIVSEPDQGTLVRCALREPATH